MPRRGHTSAPLYLTWYSCFSFDKTLTQHFQAGPDDREPAPHPACQGQPSQCAHFL